MREKIKNLGNIPLVIILIIVIIIAIVLSVMKAQNSEEINANTTMSETIKKEEADDSEIQEIDEIEIIDAEELDELDEESEEDEELENIDATYFIRVNYGQNVVTIYTKDSNGEYTVPYKAMVCSTGTATPRSGTYTLPGSGTKLPRGTWGMMIGNVWAQYYTRIKGSILFHSVPYTERNKGSLEYWEYDKLGTAASAGCIRLTVEDAKWIYQNCPAGTKVEFYSDSNPGPLGKPTAQIISNEEEVRGWDPTDPDTANPWKTYTPKEEEELEEEPKTPIETTRPSTTTKPSTQKPTTPTTPDKPTDSDSDDETTTVPDGSDSKEEIEGNEPSGEEPSEGEVIEPNPGSGETTKPDTNEGESSKDNIEKEDNTAGSEGNEEKIEETTKPAENVSIEQTEIQYIDTEE